MQLVIKTNDQVKTTSLLVAQKFKMEHKNVLQKLEKLECTKEFRRLNFQLSSYKSLQNKTLPFYILTKDGFSLMVMSFAGPMATKFKQDFIDEFNRMEALIKAETAVAKPLLEVYSKRIINNQARNCPDTHWCIFTESHSIMIPLEVNVGSQCEFDLVDGSIGIHWRGYRKDKLWASEEVEKYDYVFNDRRGTVKANCYEMDELKYFRHWLKNVYKREHLATYLKNKYSTNPTMLRKVEAYIPLLLKAS